MPADRRRLSVTGDVRAVAVVIAPVLVERGEPCEPLESLESLAARTGPSAHRVDERLRPPHRHACVRSRGGAGNDGAARPGRDARLRRFRTTPR
ncbi:hypothetical protein GCM10019016_075020 [Streptomyces prasinosporus]|uniref:Uncharacterized protein n=1 Tax=Streptomyces prasinosporus TaxID=68256 RepID=A0ABP6U253_9ACTN